MSKILVRVTVSPTGQRYLSAKDIWKELGDGKPNTYQDFLDCLRLMFPTESEFQSQFVSESYTKKSGKNAKRFYVSEFIAFYIATVYLNYTLAVSIQEGGKDVDSK